MSTVKKSSPAWRAKMLGPQPGHSNGADRGDALIDALQSSPYRDIDLAAKREPMPVREVKL
jgi:hypothetical protein